MNTRFIIIHRYRIAIALLLTLAPLASPAAERDILDAALERPLGTAVNGQPVRFGDPSLDSAEITLRDSLPRPWTATRIHALFQAAFTRLGQAQTQGNRPQGQVWDERIALVEHLGVILAASRDPRAALALGQALESSEGHVVACPLAFSFLQYFGTDSSYRRPATREPMLHVGYGCDDGPEDVHRWWLLNHIEVERRAAAITAVSPPCPRCEQQALVAIDQLRRRLHDKVTRTLAEAQKMLATHDREQVRDAVHKVSLLHSLRSVPLYMQAFAIADSLADDYVQGVVVDGLGWLRKHHPDDDLKEVTAGLQKASQPGAAIPQVREQAEEYLKVSVAGRVLDANGNPVTNARVGIFHGVNPDNAPCPRSVKPEECLDYLFSMGADRAHAVTGEDGHYTLRVPGGLVLNSDTLWVEGADARGERLRTFRMIDTCCGPRAQVGSIVLQQVADFTALIQHEDQPIADAQVSFLPGFLYGDPQQTDATGSVTTHRNLNARGDSVAMIVRAEGFATEYRNGTVRPGTTTQTIDLARETVLTGRIIGPGGKPLAQATLRAIFVPGTCPPCFPLYWDPIASTTRTDGAGMFTLHGLRAGQSYRLLIDADGPSVACGERLVTAGSGPIVIALNKAVPVTLAISGLRGVLPLQGVQNAESIAADASFNKMVIEHALSAQPELVYVTRACFGCGPGLTILMEWLDPDTGAWLPVLSPRKVTVRDATHADLRFDKVPIGTIRISTTGELQIAVQTFDPVTIRAGRRVVIPVQVTALRQLEVQVIDREGRPVSGDVRVVVGSADGQFMSGGSVAADGTLTFETDPTRDMSIRVIEADKVISTTPVPRGAARSNPLVMTIRL